MSDNRITFCNQVFTMDKNLKANYTIQHGIGAIGFVEKDGEFVTAFKYEVSGNTLCCYQFEDSELDGLCRWEKDDLRFSIVDDYNNAFHGKDGGLVKKWYENGKYVPSDNRPIPENPDKRYYENNMSVPSDNQPIPENPEKWYEENKVT